ncbi:MAG: hypothetical protein WC517_04125 [Patescibacteria group bacterium]
MDKKYLSLASLTVILVFSTILLSGCGNQPTDGLANQGRVDEEPSTESGAEAEPPTEANETATAPIITDEELDQEIKNIDADLEAIKATGFESTDLSDKDLGL